MNVKLKIKPLIKKCRGYCAAYSVKNLVPELNLNEIIQAFNNEPFIRTEDFEKLSSLGLTVNFCESIDELFEKLKEQPLIYLDFKNHHCGVIYGYDSKRFYIFDLKKKRKVKHEDLCSRLADVVALKKA